MNAIQDSLILSDIIKRLMPLFNKRYDIVFEDFTIIRTFNKERGYKDILISFTDDDCSIIIQQWNEKALYPTRVSDQVILSCSTNCDWVDYIIDREFRYITYNDLNWDSKMFQLSTTLNDDVIYGIEFVKSLTEINPCNARISIFNYHIINYKKYLDGLIKYEKHCDMH